MKLRKINEHGSSHSRNFILTNKRILLLDKLSKYFLINYNIKV